MSQTTSGILEDYDRERRDVLSGNNLRMAEEYVKQLEQFRLRPPSEREAYILKKGLDEFFLSPRNQYVLQWQIPSICTPRLKAFMQSVEESLREQMRFDVHQGIYSKRPLTNIEIQVIHAEHEVKKLERLICNTRDDEKLLELREEKARWIQALITRQKELDEEPERGFYDYVKPSYDMYVYARVA